MVKILVLPVKLISWFKRILNSTTTLGKDYQMSEFIEASQGSMFTEQCL